jgi:hypothetical protein
MTDDSITGVQWSAAHFCASHGGDDACPTALENALWAALAQGAAAWNATKRDRFIMERKSSGNSALPVEKGGVPLFASVAAPCVRLRVVGEHATGAGAYVRASEWLAEGLRNHPRVLVVKEGDDNKDASPTTFAAEGGLGSSALLGDGMDSSVLDDDSVDWYLYLWLTTRKDAHSQGASYTRDGGLRGDSLSRSNSGSAPAPRDHFAWLSPEVARLDRRKLVVIDLQVESTNALSSGSSIRALIAHTHC